jgi:hypothetical protein
LQNLVIQRFYTPFLRRNWYIQKLVEQPGF